MRSPSSIAFAALLIALLWGAAAAERPNVILIMTDDQGYGDFGFMGNPVVETPHLDAMAARSAQMTQFYVSPVCAPTRASLMTGRYNYRTRAIDTYIGRAMMEPEETTIAEILRDAGYATGLFGKWHLGDNYPMRPSEQGFEESLRHRGGGIGQPSDPPGGERKYTDPILFHNNVETQSEGYCTDLYFDGALDFIEESLDEGRNFFAYISTNAPHSPFHDVPEALYQHYLGKDLSAGLAPDASDGAYTRLRDTLARIYAMEANIDDNVGRLFDKLRTLDAFDNTVVIFLTDNGPNGPRYVRELRGQKGGLLEGGIRSPFLVHWPARLEAGAVSDRIAAHIDVLPTILEMCDVGAPADIRPDGRSLLPLLRGDAVDWPDRVLFFQWHRGDEPEMYRKFAARSQRWKLVHTEDVVPAETTGFSLYDLQSDPGELENVASRYSGAYENLLNAYEDWFESVGNTRPDNYAPPRIHVGTPHEDPVCLTRQDWRITGGPEGWGANSLGHWLIHVARAGRYDIRATFEASNDMDRTLTFRCGDVDLTVAVARGESGHSFEDVALPKGDARVELEFSHPDGPRGVHQAYVSGPRL